MGIHFKHIMLSLAAATAVFTAAAAPTTRLQIIPQPQKVKTLPGVFTFHGDMTFAVENDGQRAVAETFTTLLRRHAGFAPDIEVGAAQGDLQFTTDPTLSPEAYEMEITPRRIAIRAASGSGFFYALQSLRQLLPATIDGAAAPSRVKWSVPAARISDAPRFGYRGLMIDVARFFTPKEDLLRIIDCAAMLKLNTLHLHLMDDNGWRIEIKRYPRLTEVGSRRVERPGQLFPERRNQRQGEPTVATGFYTQDDIREIVRYAAQRHVEVIPELEMPAHSNAALAAYPLLACPVVDKYISVLPGIGGSHADIIYCAGNDRVYEFLQNIIDELVELFPSRYIHLGGDEAWKTHWKECPLCQKRIKDEGLKDEEALQGYFMARISRYVQSKGKEVMGWDELTNTDIPEGAIIFGWRGNGYAALKAARQGHRFVMTPARVLYLIRYQGPQWFEPFTYFGNNTLSDVYHYEPVQKDWDTATADLLMGVQASMWTEFCSSADDVEHQVFPRLAALAEVAWTPGDRKDWAGFLPALDNYVRHLDGMGVNYARSMFNIQHKVTVGEGALKVTLECERPDVEIRYTTDGTTPTARSRRYTAPLTVSRTTTVKSATFIGRKPAGEVLTLPLVWNKATAKPVISGNRDAQLLTNGLRGSRRYSDFEWTNWETDRPNTFTVDLLGEESISRVSVGTVNNYGMAAHRPSMIRCTLLDAQKREIASQIRRFTPEEIFREGIFTDDEVFDFETQRARYVVIEAQSGGACPPTHVKPASPSRYYFDEISIN